jgi:ribosome-associated toxin RatA of RatAB toxin-antitoxin module
MKDNSQTSPGTPARGQQSHSMLIPSTPAKCWAVITDFERYPEWSPRCESVKIRERYPDGRARIVETIIDIFFRKARYVLDYTYDEEKFTLRWTYVEGDVKNVTGEFRFEEYPEDQAYAYYFLDIEYDFYVPDKIRDMLAKRTMRDVLRTLKAEVLRRG